MEASIPFRAQYGEMEGSAWVNARVTGVVGFEAGALVIQRRERRQRFSTSPLAAATGRALVQDEGATITTAIPLEDIVSIELRGGYILPPRLRVTVKRLELLDPFRWARGARLTLRLGYPDRAAGREFALTVDSLLLDCQLARLADG